MGGWVDLGMVTLFTIIGIVILFILIKNGFKKMGLYSRSTWDEKLLGKKLYQDEKDWLEVENQGIRPIKFTRKEAIEKLKESKELLDLDLISQDAYNQLRDELSPFVLDTSLIDQKNIKSSKKSSHMPFFVPILIPLIGLIIWYFVSSGNNFSLSEPIKYYCDECGDGISGQPYQCILYMCRQPKEGQVASGLETCCSCSCGVEHRRKEGFKYECY